MGKCGVVICKSKRQRKVVDSTGQAETYAVVSLIKDLEWVELTCRELGLNPVRPIHIDVDNAGVVKQSENQVNHSNAKHYRVSQDLIRCRTKAGLIKLKKVHTKDNVADILTKWS